MNQIIMYFSIFAVLLLLEYTYFKIADKYNIIDKPNERSSHSTIVLRGGGIIFLLGIWLWSILHSFSYPWMLAGITLAAGISFADDIRSLPDSIRLSIHFIAMGLVFQQLGLLHLHMWWIVIIALIVFVGATNIINFMDGINGLTAANALACLLPLYLLNQKLEFIETSFLAVNILAVIVFSIFNFRPRGKAKCFAGDVGSVGIAFILLFSIGKLIVQTEDITWLICLVVYGVDGCLTIVHRIMLHENLGTAHRKHAYQIMANELHMSHITVSIIYMVMQLTISMLLIYVVPNTMFWHILYLTIIILVLSAAYILFMKKYYRLHELYLAQLN